MSVTVGIEEAQARLKDLIAGLGPDDEIVITERNRPVARIIGGQQRERKPRMPGNCKGVISLLVEDDEHLADFGEYMP